MLIGNYGRHHQQEQLQEQQEQQQQVVDPSSSFDLHRSSQLHLTTTSTTTSSQEVPGRLHHLPSDQMLACQQQSPQSQPPPLRGGGANQPSQQQQQQQQQQERRLKPQSDQVLKCPRCDSMNTKFCYFNNYSLTQPRHFCKSCKRYWTKGGALRNVPVGGGCRKNKRVKQQQRQQDHGNAAGGAAANHGGDELSSGGGGSDGTSGGGVLGPGSNDGASSSSILQQQQQQQDFPSPAGYHHDVVHHKGPSPFDRVSEHVVSRIYSTPVPPPPPISINWASQMALSNHHHQASYDAAASMLGLNLPASIKQEHGVGTADLTSMFDPSLAAAAAAAAAAQSMGSYHVPMDNFGFNGPGGEVLWRFPQPKLVSLLEDGGSDEARQGLLDLEVGATGGGGGGTTPGDKLKPKSKASGDTSGMQVSSEYDQADSSSQEWQQAPGDGYFEPAGGDTSGYWGNGGTTGWSSEMHPYGAAGAASGAGPGGTSTAGSQLM